MMAETYSAVVTNLGTSLIEDAYNNSSIVNITQMAIGDSNGAYVEPNPAFTSLVNELGREDIHESSTVGHLIHVYVYVTSKFAGETIREFGLYDDANNLVVYAAYPESLVPDAASGEYIQLEIECIVDLENAEVVNIVVNPIYPHATELEAGIAKIVSEADVDNDEEDSKFLTIKKLLKRAATTVKAGVARFSTSAEAINGTDTSVMLNPSSGLALLKSRISSALGGTRTDYSASEDALRQVNEKAVNAQSTANSAVKRAGDTMSGVLGIIGLRSTETGTNVFVPDAEGGNGIYAGTKEQWFRIFAKEGLAQVFDGESIFKIYHTGNPPSVSELAGRAGWFINDRQALLDANLTYTNLPLGTYVQVYTSSATTARGYPTTEAGVLDVSPTAGGRKTLIYTTYNSKRMFITYVDNDAPDAIATDWAEFFSDNNPPSLSDVAEHIGKAATCRTIGYAEAGIGGTPSPLIFGELQDPFDITTLESSGTNITVNFSGYYMLNSTLRWDVHDGDKSIDVSIYVNGTIVETLTFRTEGLIGAMALPFQYYAHFSAGDSIKVGVLVNLESGSTAEGYISSNGSLSLTYTRPSDSAATRVGREMKQLAQIVSKACKKIETYERPE
ncbi:TPA: phage tail protein [Vibrio parahaemolyticus]